MSSGSRRRWKYRTPDSRRFHPGFLEICRVRPICIATCIIDEHMAWQRHRRWGGDHAWRHGLGSACMVKKFSAFLGSQEVRQQFLRPHHDAPRPGQMVLVRRGRAPNNALFVPILAAGRHRRVIFVTAHAVRVTAWTRHAGPAARTCRCPPQTLHPARRPHSAMPGAPWRSRAARCR